MQNMASGSSEKKKAVLPIIGGIVILALIIAIIVLSIGQKEQKISYEATLASITGVAQTLNEENISANVDITATPTEVTPKVTATMVEPTEIPDMATPELPTDQQISTFSYVCMDNNYDSTIKEYSSFDRNTASFRESDISDGVINASIPVLACMVEVEVLQPVSEDLYVAFYQARDSAPWYEIKLEPVSGKDNRYYAIVNHQYLIDPPYWNLSYGLKIQDNETVYWEGSLILTRPFSGLCWEGSMPDPVTLKCPQADSLEREPHPDMPTLVPGGLHN
jgi:hypothetical protein